MRASIDGLVDICSKQQERFSVLRYAFLLDRERDLDINGDHKELCNTTAERSIDLQLLALGHHHRNLNMDGPDLLWGRMQELPKIMLSFRFMFELIS